MSRMFQKYLVEILMSTNRQTREIMEGIVNGDIDPEETFARLIVMLSELESKIDAAGGEYLKTKKGVSGEN